MYGDVGGRSELLEAAAGEGRTVNRDWCIKHRGRFSSSRFIKL